MRSALRPRGRLELGKEVADMYDLESGEHFDDMQQEFKQRIGELVSAK